ncbi:lymphatic vessel endothelial hyaluronic acid receptor 1 isoform X1 [Engystomops pustulosus]|uniref:lymphatic vessel endothelial hyaluronic acid receptor 1 isoform X1 n=1 Tax=Engystomops pustulosus TaxID=76066 RepID=UPI003AFA8D28
MSPHYGVLFVLLTFVLGGHLSASSIDLKDLIQGKCRFAGVVLVEYQDRKPTFNYSMAESACQALGLELASRAQVEKARGYGYETCSYGWVLEQFGVIPRIQNNPNCGKNKTGVLTWTVHYSKPFNAYCFNGSDIRINSCKPELMVTQQPSTVVVPTSASTMASTMASTSLRTEPETTPTLTSKPYVRTSPKALTTQTATTRTTTMTTSEPTTTTAKTPIPTTLLTMTIEDTESPKNQNQMSQKSERIVFGDTKPIYSSPRRKLRKNRWRPKCLTPKRKRVFRMEKKRRTPRKMQEALWRRRCSVSRAGRTDKLLTDRAPRPTRDLRAPCPSWRMQDGKQQTAVIRSLAQHGGKHLDKQPRTQETDGGGGLPSITYFVNTGLYCSDPIISPLVAIMLPRHIPDSLHFLLLINCY